MRWVQFVSEHLYGDVHEIALPIRVRPSANPPFTVYAILDTGAESTFFDNSLAARFGIANIASGRPTKVREASERESDGFIHDVEIEIFGNVLTVPVTFVPTWNAGTENLLGMEGVFEPFVFGIDHQARALYAKPS